MIPLLIIDYAAAMPPLYAITPLLTLLITPLLITPLIIDIITPLLLMTLRHYAIIDAAITLIIITPLFSMITLRHYHISFHIEPFSFLPLS
jgi:hypothetical protein